MPYWTEVLLKTYHLFKYVFSIMGYMGMQFIYLEVEFKYFNKFSLKIVRKRKHEISLTTKQKQICNITSAINTKRNTYIFLYNFEPILIKIVSKR